MLKSDQKAEKLSALQGEIERIMEEHAAQGRLPTERELAHIVGNSRHAVRRALERLEADGRISRHVGKGTFIGAGPVGDLMVPGMIANHCSPRQIAEARHMIEPQFAMLAAINGTAIQIAAIEVHAKHCFSARNIDAYETADENFHRSIAAATGNAVHQALFETINTIRKRIVWGKMRRVGLSPQRRAVFSTQHESVYRAIANRDADEALQAMRTHTETISEVYHAIYSSLPLD